MLIIGGLITFLCTLIFSCLQRPGNLWQIKSRRPALTPNSKSFLLMVSTCMSHDCSACYSDQCCVCVYNNSLILSSFFFCPFSALPHGFVRSERTSDAWCRPWCCRFSLGAAVRCQVLQKLQVPLPQTGGRGRAFSQPSWICSCWGPPQVCKLWLWLCFVQWVMFRDEITLSY